MNPISGLGERPAWWESQKEAALSSEDRGWASLCVAQKRATESEGKGALTLAAPGGLGIFSLTAVRNNFTRAPGASAISGSWAPAADTPSLSSPGRSPPKAALGLQRAVQGQGGYGQLRPAPAQGGGH